jgi:hypothetical protein
MANANATQAQNILRRIAQDPTRIEAQKAAKALIDQIRGIAQGLTVESVLHVACAESQDDDSLTAVMRLDRKVVDAHAADLAFREIFKAAHQAEEQRLAPFDAACAKRGDEIQKLLEAAHLDYRSKILNQDFPERRYKSYVDKGLTAAEIKALDIPEPIHGRDFVAERNQWGFELEQVTRQLTTERDTLEAFKHSRNEKALPDSVLGLVQTQKVPQ